MSQPDKPQGETPGFSSRDEEIGRKIDRLRKQTPRVTLTVEKGVDALNLYPNDPGRKGQCPEAPVIRVMACCLVQGLAAKCAAQSRGGR